jgi:hypothetical protein
MGGEQNNSRKGEQKKKKQGKIPVFEKLQHKQTAEKNSCKLKIPPPPQSYL